jgi:hypothetical protein
VTPGYRVKTASDGADIAPIGMAEWSHQVVRPGLAWDRWSRQGEVESARLPFSIASNHDKTAVSRMSRTSNDFVTDFRPRPIRKDRRVTQATGYCQPIVARHYRYRLIRSILTEDWLIFG